MSENEVIEQEEGRLEKVKEVVKKIDWKSFAVGVVVTGVTIAVTKRFGMRMNYTHIEGTNTFVHKAALKDNSTFYKVFNIYSPGFKNHGPSWMIRCVETGRGFSSYTHAAKVMNVPKEQFTAYFAGKRSSVAGKHFVKLGVGV